MHVNGMGNGLREGCKAIVDAREREKEKDRIVRETEWGWGFLRHPYISTTQRLTDFPKIRVNRPVCSRGGIVETHRRNWMNDRGEW